MSRSPSPQNQTRNVNDMFTTVNRYIDFLGDFRDTLEEKLTGIVSLPPQRLSDIKTGNPSIGNFIPPIENLIPTDLLPTEITIPNLGLEENLRQVGESFPGLNLNEVGRGNIKSILNQVLQNIDFSNLPVKIKLPKIFISPEDTLKAKVNLRIRDSEGNQKQFNKESQEPLFSEPHVDQYPHEPTGDATYKIYSNVTQNISPKTNMILSIKPSPTETNLPFQSLDPAPASKTGSNIMNIPSGGEANIPSILSDQPYEDGEALETDTSIIILPPLEESIPKTVPSPISLNPFEASSLIASPLISEESERHIQIESEENAENSPHELNTGTSENIRAPEENIETPEFTLPPASYCQEHLSKAIISNIRNQLINPEHNAFSDFLSQLDGVEEGELFTVKLPYDMLTALIEGITPISQNGMIDSTSEVINITDLQNSENTFEEFTIEPERSAQNEGIFTLDDIQDDFEHDHALHQPDLLEERIEAYIAEHLDSMDPESADLILIPSDPISP